MARVARIAAQATQRVQAAVTTAAASSAALPVTAACLVVILVVASIAALMAPATQRQCSTGSVTVPQQAQPWVDEAAETSGIDPALIAAIMSQESGFQPTAHADDSNGGTWGLFQMNRSVWRGVHPEGADQTPPEGITDPMTHAHYGGLYLRNRLAGVQRLKASHPDAAFSRLSDDDALVIAHNAGEGGLMRYPDIPAVTRTYLENVHRMVGSGGGSCAAGDGAQVGSLSPPLVMQADGYHVDVSATGTDENGAPSYDRFQCTWWAAIRRLQIGRPVDAHMGNGAEWNDSAARLGYPVSASPRPGDVMCFEAGVHGSDPVYGHVAVVEEVKADGSVTISQSGTGWMAVVIETIGAAQLQAMGSGISFIH